MQGLPSAAPGRAIIHETLRHFLRSPNRRRRLTDLPGGVEARLFRPTNEPSPQGWETISARPIVQMVFDQPHSDAATLLREEVISLGTDDVPEMVALANVAKPGPFAIRTIELGNYVGVRHAATERLVAMGGERFRPPCHIELSAIAVHPDARGRGLGAAVTLHLVQLALARGLMPFLHVFPENPAVALYSRLGFHERAKLWVLWRRPLTNGTK
jgi:ribosomal protein S18 acetylase RimI-like enzyme